MSNIFQKIILIDEWKRMRTWTLPSGGSVLLWKSHTISSCSLLKLPLLNTYCERCWKGHPVTRASISYFRDDCNDRFHGVSSRTKFRSCLARFSCCAYLGHRPSSPMAFREGGWGGFTPYSGCRRVRLLAICDEARWKAIRLYAWLTA